MKRAQYAIGIIETCGIPTALVVADIMGKAAEVEVVGIENTGTGRISVIVKGLTGAVKAALSAAINSLDEQSGAIVLGHHVLPCPDNSADPSWRPWLHGSQHSSDDTAGWLDD
ncbi:BMC domain-containing protein [Oscillatoria sp. CS-180]|uniref:BMC domain-containing protein n=1 Tax=Oscillatoria sp. CS-180 TaxID=3021720 RepID=UPI00233049D7|nr:BMC domain-containing protein [Oscillatoria sp. CS-180]MDB9525900.1 BMC domain-containing protein [Oscillatoria sp. CS-180]